MAFHLDEQGYGPTVLALDGLPEVPIGAADATTPRITGHPALFILAATGRGNPTDFGADETLNIYR